MSRGVPRGSQVHSLDFVASVKASDVLVISKFVFGCGHTGFREGIFLSIAGRLGDEFGHKFIVTYMLSLDTSLAT